MNVTNSWILLFGAVAATGLCRVAGYVIARLLPEDPAIRKTLTALPACALAAVLGPQIVAMSFSELLSLSTAGLVFWFTKSLLASFSAGFFLLLSLLTLLSG